MNKHGAKMEVPAIVAEHRLTGLIRKTACGWYTMRRVTSTLASFSKRKHRVYMRMRFHHTTSPDEAQGAVELLTVFLLHIGAELPGELLVPDVEGVRQLVLLNESRV
jgi:hypothetical protein